jgi:hypothetical protein
MAGLSAGWLVKAKEDALPAVSIIPVVPADVFLTKFRRESKFFFMVFYCLELFQRTGFQLRCFTKYIYLTCNKKIFSPFMID